MGRFFNNDYFNFWKNLLMELRPEEGSQKQRLVQNILVSKFEVSEDCEDPLANLSCLQRVDLLTSYLRLVPKDGCQIPILNHQVTESILCSDLPNKTYTLQQKLITKIDKSSHYKWVLNDQGARKKIALNILKTGKGRKWADFLRRKTSLDFIVSQKQSSTLIDLGNHF